VRKTFATKSARTGREQVQQLKPNFYSMTSSVRASKVGGMARPSLGGRQIDDEFEFGRKLYRQIAGVGALQYLEKLIP